MNNTDQNPEMLKMLNGAAESLKQCSAIAQKMQDALRVLTETPHIKAYLAVMDPQALRQARTALGDPAWYDGGLPDLRSMRLIWDALQQFVDNSVEVEDDERVQRDAVHAQGLVERIEVGLVPLMEREDRIFNEEVKREQRKAAYEDHDAEGQP